MKTTTKRPRKTPHCHICRRPRKGHPIGVCPYGPGEGGDSPVAATTAPSRNEVRLPRKRPECTVCNQLMSGHGPPCAAGGVKAPSTFPKASTAAESPPTTATLAELDALSIQFPEEGTPQLSNNDFLGTPALDALVRDFIATYNFDLDAYSLGPLGYPLTIPEGSADGYPSSNQLHLALLPEFSAFPSVYDSNPVSESFLYQPLVPDIDTPAQDFLFNATSDISPYGSLADPYGWLAFANQGQST
ncbi:hypothetical protein BOTBODRAFT_485555 [Botryobasidium botryosum FD-172 SS1]|uniref:Uncharacterized protein n=1 Tax=Botryobasidium botryosum (strain FD-172 SS1) TaxID=930990 RepID=A0A067N4U1_BOTB1|nr:hypothetical protein BOTBODRAFT_485555 [Botryobasidium botryosum FD-172 SS1]